MPTCVLVWCATLRWSTRSSTGQCQKSAMRSAPVYPFGWFFAIAMIPEFMIRQSYQVLEQKLVTCHDIQSYEKAFNRALIPYRLSLICLGFILPSLVITFVYGSIIYHLNRSSCDWKHYLKASTLVFGIFFVCFAPCNALLFAHYVKLYTQQQYDLYYYYNATVCLCSFHSCLDPFLSYFLTKTSTSQVKIRSFSSTASIALSMSWMLLNTRMFLLWPARGASLSKMA